MDEKQEVDTEINTASSVTRQAGARWEMTKRYWIKLHLLQGKGLTGKVNGLTTRLGTWGWDVIAITKTWLRVGQDWQLNVLGAAEN